MTEAPKRVWLDSDAEGEGQHTRCFGSPKYCSEPAIEYIRKDVSDVQVATAREEALREAAHIVSRAGHSLDAEILALITKDADNG